MGVLNDIDNLDIKIRNSRSNRFVDNLANDSRIDRIKKLLVKQEISVKLYDMVSTEERDKITYKLLKDIYSLLENTDFKSKLVDEYNNQLKKSPQLYNILKSVLPNNNNGMVEGRNRVIDIESATSKDIFTEDFKQILLDTTLSYDEKMQKLAFWSNKVAHECVIEIKEMSDYFLDDIENNEVLKTINATRKTPGAKFKFLIERAIYDKNIRAEYRFNADELVKLIDSKDFDMSKCKDENFVKFKKLMDNLQLNCKNPNDVKRIVHCMQMQEMCDMFFDIKDNAIENLAKYLNDPNVPEEQKNVVMFKVNDSETLSSSTNYSHEKGLLHSTSRIVIMNKDMYEDYCKFCSKGFITNKLAESYALSKNITPKEARARLKNIYRGRELSETERIAILSACSATVLHANNIGLKRLEKKNNIKIPDLCSPLITSIAFSGTPISPLRPIKNLASYLTGIKKNNDINKSRFSGNLKKFVSSISRPIIKSMEKIIISKNPNRPIRYYRDYGTYDKDKEKYKEESSVPNMGGQEAYI